MDNPLTCNQIKNKLKGSKEDRVEIAKMELPEECACEVFDELSKDKDRLVRFNLSKNTKIPDSCSCELFGRLTKDKDSGVRTFTKINKKFKHFCGGMPDIKKNKWHGFDAIKEDIDCKFRCNTDFLKGRFDVEDDVDVVSVNKTSDDTKKFLESEGFIEKPVRITWIKDVSTLDEYIDKVKKGRDIKKGLNSLEEGKRNEDINIVFDKGLKNEELYRQWYKLYKESMEDRDRGRVLINETEYPKRFTGMYAVDKDGNVIGGRMIREHPEYNSVAYSAFKQGRKYLNEIAYGKMIEYTIKQGKNRINLGLDTNFYGYHLSPGVYKSKTLFGFIPKTYRPKGYEHFKVKKDDKFDDVYMFLSGPKDNLKNNIFVKKDKEIKKDDYPAPDGVEITNL